MFWENGQASCGERIRRQVGGFLHKFLTNSGAWFPKLLSVGDINILEKTLDENIKPGTGATQHITHLVSALDGSTVFTAAPWQRDSGAKGGGHAVSTAMWLLILRRSWGCRPRAYPARSLFYPEGLLAVTSSLFSPTASFWQAQGSGVDPWGGLVFCHVGVTPTFWIKLFLFLVLGWPSPKVADSIEMFLPCTISILPPRVLRCVPGPCSEKGISHLWDTSGSKNWAAADIKEGGEATFI